MSYRLFVGYANYPYLECQRRICRNYAKRVVPEAIFATEKDFALFAWFHSKQSVPDSFQQSCILHIHFKDAVVRVGKVPVCRLSGLFVVGCKQTGG